MNQALPPSHRLLVAAALCCLPVLSHAGPVTQFVPYEGAGNLLVIDAAAGTGAWTGSIDQSPFPAVPTPLALVSVVTFQLDAALQTFSGSFEFTNAGDLASTLFGDITGSYFDADILFSGGQFSVDYTILGGTGAFSGASGYGLSFVGFDPMGVFNNYAEAGQLVFTVPEPATLTLTSLGLLAALAALPRRRVAPGALARMA